MKVVHSDPTQRNPIDMILVWSHQPCSAWWFWNFGICVRVNPYPAFPPPRSHFLFARNIVNSIILSDGSDETEQSPGTMDLVALNSEKFSRLGSEIAFNFPFEQ